jgi:REP element-mobilizing transposase RayT
MSSVYTLRFARRNLPHWLVADRTFFVTIRLAGSLPKAVVEALQREREDLRRRLASDNEVLDALRRQFLRVEAILDSVGPDEMLFGDSAVAQCLLDRLSWLSEPARGWDIHAVTIMGNHVHLLMRNRVGRSGCLLSDIGQYKRQTAYWANRLLGRTGAFWAREDFDHWCRDQGKVVGAVRYMAKNPVKAGLCRDWREWRWTMIASPWVQLARLDDGSRTGSCSPTG